MPDEVFHHYGEQKLNMMIVFCFIKLQGVKALCCRSATRSAVYMLGVCHAGVSLPSFQNVLCSGYCELMCLSAGKVTMQLPWIHWWWQNTRQALGTACMLALQPTCPCL